MPRIDDACLESVIYLYQSEAHAKAGIQTGGTGFLVSVPSSKFPNEMYVYAVTNKHIVEDARSRTIRLNDNSGGIDILDTKIEDWKVAQSDDLAVIPVEISMANHKFRTVPERMFVTPEIVERIKLGPGDEVYLPGRFINHEGKQCNTPAVRFGNLSMMPTEPVQQPGGSMQDSFLVDMRSLSGYSGSPAFVFIPPAEGAYRHIHQGDIEVAGYGPWLLGIDWGHLASWSCLVYKADKKKTHPENLGITSNSGIAAIVPAWKLHELLHRKDLQMQRKQLDEERAEETSVLDYAASGEPEETFTRSDFESALKKVSRRIQPSQSDEEK